MDFSAFMSSALLSCTGHTDSESKSSAPKSPSLYSQETDSQSKKMKGSESKKKRNMPVSNVVPNQSTQVTSKNLGRSEKKKKKAKYASHSLSNGPYLDIPINGHSSRSDHHRSTTTVSAVPPTEGLARRAIEDDSSLTETTVSREALAMRSIVIHVQSTLKDRFAKNIIGPMMHVKEEEFFLRALLINHKNMLSKFLFYHHAEALLRKLQEYQVALGIIGSEIPHLLESVKDSTVTNLLIETLHGRVRPSLDYAIRICHRAIWHCSKFVQSAAQYLRKGHLHLFLGPVLASVALIKINLQTLSSEVCLLRQSIPRLPIIESLRGHPDQQGKSALANLGH